MEAANKLGDVRKIYHVVKKLDNKPKPPPSNLTTDEDGKLLKDPKAKAARWGSFLRKKFQAVNTSRGREASAISTPH